MFTVLTPNLCNTDIDIRELVIRIQTNSNGALVDTSSGHLFTPECQCDQESD